MPLKSIENVEVFSVGTWNGKVTTDKDLENMVQAFKDNEGSFRPFLKLGHDEEQKLLQKDGLPAAGWVYNLRKVGSKLVADFKDIPDKIYTIIKNGGYKSRSAEVFRNIQIGEKVYDKMLGAVAFLGAEFPGVKDLDSILNLYIHKAENIEKFSKNEIEKDVYQFEGEIMAKTEREIELEKELAIANSKIATKEADVEKYKNESQTVKTSLEAEKQKLADENKEKQKEIEKYKLEAQTAAEAAKKAEIETFVADLEKEKLCTPAMKQLVIQLMEPEKEKYSITIDKKEKEVSRKELIKELFKLLKSSQVNVDNHSEDGDKGEKGISKDAIEKYASENKCSFGDAYVKLMEEKQADKDEE